ncbi:MAG: hypothetical protein HKK67_02175, partial [Chlorobiaceae bacterium]|nr:hypothetical protein [Chlorobiaceae bacterium]
HYSPVRVAHIAPESLAHFTPVEVAHYAPVCSARVCSTVRVCQNSVVVAIMLVIPVEGCDNLEISHDCYTYYVVMY